MFVKNCKNQIQSLLKAPCRQSCNSLAIKYSPLVKEWHPAKNGILTPYDVTPFSDKVVWWKCPKGDDHEWQAAVKTRSKGHGCGVCAGRVVVKTNCLATLNPELAKEWHTTKNGNLTPSDVIPGSCKKVWWKCQKDNDHIWQAKIKDRNNGTSCPICSNKKVVKSNCLAALNPKLAKEWHPTKNDELTAEKVTPGSLRKAWWTCPKGDDHEWQATIAKRNKGTGCPICKGQKIAHSNCLETLNPKLAKEWHPFKNGKLTPYDVLPGAGKKVWWKCHKGDDHEWQATIANRKHGRNCPVCTGQQIAQSNCLATLYPEIAKQWHPTKNGKLTPRHFTGGMSKKIWWKCPKGDDHEWQTTINHRTSGTGCPKCNPAYSIPELRIFSELRAIFQDVQHRFIIQNCEVDIYIPEFNIGIEYDGVYWHQDKHEKDLEKHSALTSIICLIRIREDGLPLLSSNDIRVKKKDMNVSTIKEILKIILKYRNKMPPNILENIDKYMVQSDWIASSYFNDFYSNRKHVEFEKSLSFLFPDIAKEWHLSKNDLLLPEYFTPGSSRNIWWKGSCGHEWQDSINHRTSGRGCSQCRYKRAKITRCK